MTSLNKSFNILCHVWQPEPVLGEQEGVIGNWRNIGDRSTSGRGVKMGHILLHRSISKFTGSAAIAALPKTGKMHQLDHWSDGTQCLYGWKMCSSVKEKCYQACDWFNSGECSLVGVSTDCIQWKSQVFLCSTRIPWLSKMDKVADIAWIAHYDGAVSYCLWDSVFL